MYALPRRAGGFDTQVIIEDGTLCPRDGAPSLARMVRLARDCHEQNAQLSRGSDGRLSLVTTRFVGPGEELKAWFDIELLAELAVPVLTPAHIQGEYLTPAQLT